MLPLQNDKHFEDNTGTVFHWGDGGYGGLNDNSGGWYENGDLDGHMGITDSGVEQIFSTEKAFVALKDDGSVVTWGDADYGGDNNVGLTDELDSGVVNIKANAFAFAALKDDGSVVTWGHGDYGGDSSSVAAELISDVSGIYTAKGSFAALKNDGSVIVCGDSKLSLPSAITNVDDIISSDHEFAALKKDGSLFVWGGDISNGILSQQVKIQDHLIVQK